MCVEDREGYFSEAVSPKLVMFFGLVAESARLLSLPWQTPMITMFTANFQNQCIIESLNNGFFETFNPGVLEAQNHPSQTLRL